MSLFFGPIHATMYNRVLIQDTMAEAILQLSEKSGWASDARSKVDAAAPAAIIGPLEEVLDAGNIHGSLSGMVCASEKRFAMVAHAVLSGHPERMEAISGALSALGEQHALKHTVCDAQDAFEQLGRLLLDGMPCDRSITLLVDEAHLVQWRVDDCPHAPYWPEQVEMYYMLRKAFVDGVLKNSQFAYRHAGPQLFRIEREE